jgi:hypothetical protein
VVHPSARSCANSPWHVPSLPETAAMSRKATSDPNGTAAWCDCTYDDGGQEDVTATARTLSGGNGAADCETVPVRSPP